MNRNEKIRQIMLVHACDRPKAEFIYGLENDEITGDIVTLPDPIPNTTKPTKKTR